MGTARVAQFGVAAALLLSLLAAPAAPLPVASFSAPSSSAPSLSCTSSEACVPAALHIIISGNIGLLQFRVKQVLQAYEEMADVEISEHGAVLSVVEPCVRRAETAPTLCRLSDAFALYGGLINALCERAQLPRGSEVRTVCYVVVGLLEDTPFRLSRGGQEASQAAEQVVAEATVARRKEELTGEMTAKTRGGANDSAAVVTESLRVGSRTETAAWVVSTTAVASTAPTHNRLRGEQNTEAGIADVTNATVAAEEDEQRQRTNQQQQPQQDVDKRKEMEKRRDVEEEVDERSRLSCSPWHVRKATSLHGSSDSRIVMFALFQRFQKFLTQVSRHLKPCRP